MNFEFLRTTRAHTLEIRTGCLEPFYVLRQEHLHIPGTRAFAELLAPRIEALEEVSKVDIAGPGFINITLNLASAGMLAKTIVEAGSSYGKGDSLKGLKMNLEFVSANPHRSNPHGWNPVGCRWRLFG